MSDAPKLLYVVVVEEEEDGEAKGGSFCYTRPVLQSTLQLMGCKARHAFKISRRVFEVTRSEFSLVDLGDEVRSGISEECTENGNDGQKNSVVTQIEGSTSTPVRYGERSNSVQFELYKRQTTVVIPRGTFLDVVCDALSQYKYVGPNQRADLALACRLCTFVLTTCSPCCYSNCSTYSEIQLFRWDSAICFQILMIDSFSLVLLFTDKHQFCWIPSPAYLPVEI